MGVRSHRGSRRRRQPPLAGAAVSAREALMVSSTVLSTCGTYEYEFRRSWDPTLPQALFVMLNPSMDDYDKGRDGRTTERCKNFARSWGCGGVVFANVLALRSTSPAGLLTAADPVGPDNDRVLHRLVDELDGAPLVAGWGASYPFQHRGRVDQVRQLLRDRGAWCLGKTKTGEPSHPLYVRGSAELVPL